MTQPWPQNKCRSQWPIFHSPVILPYISKTIWWMSVVLSDNETVWPNLWPQNKYKSAWPMLHGPVILPYILMTIWWMNVILLDNQSYDSIFDLKINIGQHDLYFTAQSFSLISWRLFYCWMSYFRLMSQCDVTFDPIINVGHNDLYFMVQ